VPQNRYHAYDVYYHTLHTVDAAPAEKPAVRLAALFTTWEAAHPRGAKRRRDVLQPPVRERAARDEAMTRLRFSREMTEEVAHLVQNHMFDYRPSGATRRCGDSSRRWAPTTSPTSSISASRTTSGTARRAGFPHYLEELRGRIEAVLEARQALALKDLKIDGGDVMRELGIPPGRRWVPFWNVLLDEVLEDPGLNERGRLLRRVREAFSVDRARA
jgi:poly(A) polymerase/tRNA nucleotidyltransferase (CCA-adding enzyme)